jgi:hypothetical protein
MQYKSPILAALVCAAGLAISGTNARAQITVTSPTNNSTLTSVPVQLTASVTECAGSSDITLFEYSINSSPFQAPSPNNGTSTKINTTDYRLSAQPSPGVAYIIRFKAWSTAGACTENDVNITVIGAATTTVANIDDVANSNGWSPNACPATQKSTYGLVGWFWDWDAGTAECTCPSTISGLCTGSDSTTYTVTTSGLTIDGESRLYYVNEHPYDTTGGTPGERFSETFGNSTTATHFVYDTYIYIVDPTNIENVEMDNNQADTNGDLWIFGLQCSFTDNVWEYTINNAGADEWVKSSVACSAPWTADKWHHVQLAEHRDDTSGGSVYYDSITFDGTTSPLNLKEDSYFTDTWTAGTLLLNLQLDGIYNGGSETTITAYEDGFTEIYW